MKKIAVLFATLLLGLAMRAQETYVYALRDTVGLKLDIYRPTSPRADSACVLYLFGGGFATGARGDAHAIKICQMLADRGFVAVAMDYRLYFKHPARTSLLRAYMLFDTAICWAVEDCADAIAFLCRGADSLHLNPKRMILTGSSAGAITVLQTDYCRANQLPLVDRLPKNFVPAAVVPFSGAVFCRNRAMRYATPPAPTCMFHGTDDRIVAYHRFRGSLGISLFGSNYLARVFEKNGYNYWILRYRDRGHEIASALPNLMDEFCTFVEAVLAGRVMQYDAVCHDASIKRTKWSDMSLLDLYRK